jgi:hypothetical protein
MYTAIALRTVVPSSCSAASTMCACSQAVRSTSDVAISHRWRAVR